MRDEITELPEEIESYRDRTWRRSPDFAIDDRAGAEALVRDTGFCFALTDSRTPGPSVFIAVCGRRDAHLPRNVQKDPECSLAWRIKDDVMRAGKVYYAKLNRARSTFINPALISAFNAIWGVPRAKESKVLSSDARSILKVLRKEWEMASADLRNEAGMKGERQRFQKAMDELQRSMKVIPSDVLYEPTFTYIWTLPEARFPEQMAEKLSRAQAIHRVARSFLDAAGLTLRGELTRVTGLSRKEAGAGNHQLVDEGHAHRVEDGVYLLQALGAQNGLTPVMESEEN